MELMSLFDFLGKPAGPELGKQVAIAASEAKIKGGVREVETPKYKGKIQLYPREFLEQYFDFSKIEILPTGENDFIEELPF